MVFYKLLMMARAINQLGEQLIKSESVALLGLIKNAYDADAANCRIILTNPELPKTETIEIIDDGLGKLANSIPPNSNNTLKLK